LNAKDKGLETCVNHLKLFVYLQSNPFGLIFASK